MQSHGRVPGRFCYWGCCWRGHCQWNWLLLSAVHLSSALCISGLSAVSNAVWLRLLLQYRKRLVRSLCHGLRSVWHSNAGSFLQPVQLAPTNRAHPLQPLMAGKVSGRPTIPIPERTPQRIRDPVPPRSGVNPTSRMAINPPTHNTTPPRKERLHPRRGPRAERQSGLPPLMAMPRWEKLQAETCMPARTATFTKTRVPAGKNMTTVPAPGTPRLRPKPATGSTESSATKTVLSTTESK